MVAVSLVWVLVMLCLWNFLQQAVLSAMRLVLVSPVQLLEVPGVLQGQW
jgi:hypothetical protein